MESLFKYKDTLPDSLRANVVYKFKCGGCNATYISQTGRHLHICIHEHLGLSSITSNQIKTTSLFMNIFNKLDIVLITLVFPRYDKLVTSLIYQFWNVTLLKDSNQT